MQVNGVNSEVATATYEFHYSPTTSTCLVAIVCLPLLTHIASKLFSILLMSYTFPKYCMSLPTSLLTTCNHGILITVPQVGWEVR